LNRPNTRTGTYDPILSGLRREIALIQEQLEQTRTVNECIRRHRLRDECEISTELMQMEQRTPRYSPYRFPEREKIQRRSHALRREERQQLMSYILRMDQLHDRLLQLLNRHDQLTDWPKDHAA
jgi:hypothetical protein